MKSIYSETYRNLIGQLICARKKRGITQAELAGKLGKTQSFVAKIETCERRLDVVEFLVLSRLIGEDPCQIISALDVTGS